MHTLPIRNGVLTGVLLIVSAASSAAQQSGNPILPGWYADPEAHVFAGRYWIYPTYSAPYREQTFMDAFSSTDLVTWQKHARVLDIKDITWARRALWAPSVIEHDGWYYLFFGANDIQSDSEVGGIGVARSRNPDGPFTDHLGRPLIDKFHNGAQPIDQHVFRDRDGAHYIVYGGWRHCNIARLNDDFSGLVPFPDGSTFKEITPAGYVEGAFMLLKDTGTTSCGRKAAGRVRTTPWRTRSDLHHWGLSSGSVLSCARTPRSPRVRGTTRYCTPQRPIAGTLCITGDHWAKRIEITVSSASIDCTLTIAD
jgi:hypothetical protein